MASQVAYQLKILFKFNCN